MRIPNRLLGTDRHANLQEYLRSTYTLFPESRFRAKDYLRPLMNKFDGKVVWITGASSGIGRAVAKKLAHAGASVILSARREEELQQLAMELPAQTVSLVLPVDLTRDDDIVEATKRVYRQFDKVDLLFLAAGISQRSSVLETSLEVHHKIMEINYFSTVALTKAVLPHMVGSGGGHLAVITSLTGKFGFPMRSAYAASKHALHGFFESLYMELKDQGIRITLVVPGPVNTKISLQALGADGQPTGEMDDMQAEAMSPEACAEHIVNALQKNKREVVIGTAKEKFGAKLNAWWPSLFFKLAAKSEDKS